MEWKTIDTAPKDEEILIFVYGGTIGVGQYRGDSLWSIHCGDGCCWSCHKPSHWMPIPLPPEATP